MLCGFWAGSCGLGMEMLCNGLELTENPQMSCQILFSYYFDSTLMLPWSNVPRQLPSFVLWCTIYSHSRGSPHTNCPHTILENVQKRISHIENVFSAEVIKYHGDRDLQLI